MMSLKKPSDSMNPAEIIKAIAIATCEASLPCYCGRPDGGLSSGCAKRGKAAILATLDAIREPSEAMLGNDEISEITLRAARTLHSSELPCADIWRAMIDALKREIA